MFRNDFEASLLPYLIITIPTHIPEWFEPTISAMEPSIPDTGACTPAVRFAANHYLATGEIDASGLCAEELEEFCSFLGRCSDYRRDRDYWSTERQSEKFWQWRIFYIDRMLSEITSMLSLRNQFEDDEDDND